MLSLLNNDQLNYYENCLKEVQFQFIHLSKSFLNSWHLWLSCLTRQRFLCFPGLLYLQRLQRLSKLPCNRHVMSPINGSLAVYGAITQVIYEINVLESLVPSKSNRFTLTLTIDLWTRKPTMNFPRCMVTAAYEFLFNLQFTGINGDLQRKLQLTNGYN